MMKLDSSRKVNFNLRNNICETTSGLSFKDVLGTWKARWGINRMNYKVDEGLYRIGKPNKNSPVMVTANYKMSFDALRKELKGIDAYILVLDTKGVNVWCAASKGTFGTNELLNRINKVNLEKIVEHKNLILPQLSATGISAYEVQNKSGFKVIYGPVRAEDIKEFLKNNFNATEEMRRVRFNLKDRIVLTPYEIVNSIKPSLIIFGVMFLLNLLSIAHFTDIDAIAYLGAVLVGCIIVPMLLPFIPGRAFSFKGWLIGFLWAIALIKFKGNISILYSIAYLLILPSVSAYFALNFTGCSTYTSLSGVVKEMKVAMPIIVVSIALGLLIMLLGGLI